MGGLQATDMRRSTNGFTIIELLISIAVIGIFIPTLIAFITSLTGLNDRARDLTTMNALAENKIESLRSAGYAAVNVGTTNFSAELPASIASPKSASYTVTQPNSGMKQIDITITYNDHGTNRTTQYRTILGELGVGQ